MRFHIAITSMILLLAGCGATKQISPMRAGTAGVGAKYQRNLANYPEVAFLSATTSLLIGSLRVLSGSTKESAVRPLGRCLPVSRPM